MFDRCRRGGTRDNLVPGDLPDGALLSGYVRDKWIVSLFCGGTTTLQCSCLVPANKLGPQELAILQPGLAGLLALELLDLSRMFPVRFRTKEGKYRFCAMFEFDGYSMLQGTAWAILVWPLWLPHAPR